MGWEKYEKAGRRFDVLIQEQEADCGLCCVAMVVNLLGRGKPTSATVKANLKKGAYNPSTQDRAGFVPTMLTAARPDVATHSTGTYLQSLKQALVGWNINSVYKGPSPNIEGAIAGAQAGKPIIIHVTWNNGGGHWVVITHSMGNSHYVLDPYYGLAINSSKINYEGLKQSAHSAGAVDKVVYGRWTGEWLKIT
jgi:ABC-type bacteriocin/lantibiotic exporter with double-glycine peptidase domain